MQRIMVYIPPEQHEILRKSAFEKRTSIAAEIRKAVEQYLKQEESK